MKYMPLLGMLFITFMLTALVLVYKPINVFSVTSATAAGFVSPFVFILGDIIAEVYGYTISKRILFYALVCQFIFCAITTILIHFPSPATWNGQNSYDYVMHDFLKIYSCVVLGFYVANVINFYLISKWKILLRGKHFWLRSIGSSGIGLIIYSFITGTVIFWVLGANREFSDFFGYLFTLCFFKCAGTIVFAFPANLITFLLKRVEGITRVDQELNFDGDILAKHI